MRIFSFPFFILMVGVLGPVLSAAEPPTLTDSGLPPGPAEQVLPAGAVLHLRLGNVERTLASLDGLAASFVPEKALPPHLQELLKQPQPVLAFLGQNSIGAPINKERIAQMTGVDIGGALSLTLYLGAGQLDWALAVPTADPQALTGLLMNMLRPRSFAAVNVGKGWIIEGTNPDLPRTLRVVTSATTTYLCSPGLAERIGEAGTPHLSDDAIFSTLDPQQDFVVAVSTHAVKPMIGLIAKQMLRQYPQLAASNRSTILRNLPPELISQWNMQLRLYSRFTSFDEALTFTEAMITAAVETGVPALSGLLSGIDGGIVNIRLRPSGFRIEATAQAEGLDGNAGRALPLDDLRAAIALVPQGSLWFSAASAHMSPLGASVIEVPWVVTWLDRAQHLLQTKGSTSPVLAAMATYYREYEAVPAFTAMAPWVVTTTGAPGAAVPQGVPLAELFAFFENIPLQQPPLQIFPRVAADTLAEQFAARAAIENRNAGRLAALLAGTWGDRRFASETVRFRREPRPGKAERLVYENAWISRSGLFGYSQHELINRTIAYTIDQGPFQLFQQMNGDGPCWLDQPLPAATQLPAVLTTLLAQVPAGSDHIAVVRALPVLGEVLDLVTALEGSARVDLDAYITASENAINAHIGDQDAMLKTLFSIPMPLIVQSLNIDPTTSTLYLALPGNLRYPRPAVMPVITELFADHLAHNASQGGVVCWRVAGPRRMTVGSDQDLRGLADLVRSVGNAAWDKFFSAGHPQQAVLDVLGHPQDLQPVPPEEQILMNTLWPNPQ